MSSQYATFSLPVLRSPDQEEDLNKFLRSHKVLQVLHQLVQEQNGARWTFLVEYLEGSNAERSGQQISAIDYKDILSEDDFGLYRSLRDLRKLVAERNGLPPYSVFTNKQLAELAKVRPTTTVDLKKIEGIGEGKTERFGQDFLLAIEEYRKCAGPAA